MSARPTLTFLGAVGTVTGSKYLLQVNGSRVLVDCGLFQGPRSFRERNWRGLPFAARDVDAVLLTHAHLDHSGYLPVLVRDGFCGPVFCASGTAALARILLPDAGHLQEEDARYANHKGYSRHRSARALYTEQDARAALDVLHPVGFADTLQVANGITATFHSVGHILGAAWLEIDLGNCRVAFSGDVGRVQDPVMNEPSALRPADYVVVESTYGDRRHATDSAYDALGKVIADTAARGGIVMIPAFAVGRAQTILYLLAKLRAAGALPPVPVFLNSPMAINASDIFCDHAGEHRLSREDCRAMCGVASYVNSADESRALNRRRAPMIVISASGMASGGRILHHFKAWLGDARNTVLFTGFQAAGTRGADMLAGAASVEIHGQSYPVRAQIAQVTGLSAHADSDELIEWLRPLQVAPPKALFVTHGEPSAAAALAGRIGADLGVRAEVPAEGEERELA